MNTSQHSMIVSPNGSFDFSVQKMPVFKEMKKQDWVLWGYSSDFEDREWNNKQPEYYEWLYNSSSKHRAIINRKLLFIEGQGVKPNDKGLQFDEKVELRSFAFKWNESELTRQLTKNWLINGWFAYEVIPDKGLKKIQPHYVNSGKLRVSKPEYDAQGRQKDPVFYYTCDWNARKPKDNPDFTIFHVWKWGEETIDKNKRYIVVQSDDPEKPYPVPEYTAAVPYIAADYEVGNFVYNNTKNGFNGAYLVNFKNGTPDDEQKAQINQQFKAWFSGSDNAGETMLNFMEDDDSGIEVIPLGANGQDDRYINLNQQIRDEIFSGHTVSPAMVGLKGESGFANNADELRVEVENFQEYYVRGKQQILERHINAIKTFNGVKGELYIQRLDPIQPQPTETELAEILTVNERRERAGYEPTEEVLQRESKQLVVQMSKEDQDTEIIKFLSTCGVLDDEVEVLDSRELFAKSIEDAEAQSMKFNLESSILTLLLGGHSLKDIRDSLGLSEKELNDKLASMRERGVINEDNVPQEEPDEVFVVYKYEKRNDVSGASILPTTRPFCRNLVTLSKVKSWTLQDIKRMNNGMGLDVFTSRGGWYTLPGTDTSVPYCRHVWKQMLIRRKK